MVKRRYLSLLSLIGLCGCTPLPPWDPGHLPAGEVTGGSYLFHAETTISDDWYHMDLRGQTDYRLAVFDDAVAIRARGQGSASGLMRHLAMDPRLCPEIEWAWAVTQLQRSANLFEKSGDDVAASIFLLFGDPGSALNPQSVPTLRYVWTTDHVALESIIRNPYMDGVVRSVVVTTEGTPAASWVIVRRNIVEDFERAFGIPPADNVHAIALFTDNDQTQEPVEAFYGWARAHCTEEGISFEETETWE